MFCRKCETEKAVGEFYVSSPSRCKECVRADVRANRAKNAEYYRAYDRLRFYEQGYRSPPSKSPRKHRAWLDKNPDKRAAHVAVGKAVRAGQLVKPAKCETCDSTSRLHGHHDDYSKPLEVRWLCSRCHRAWHRKYDEAETRAIVEARRRSA